MEVTNHANRLLNLKSEACRVAEEVGTCSRRGSLVLTDALKKIDAVYMILITSFMEEAREGVGWSEGPKPSGE